MVTIKSKDPLVDGSIEERVKYLLPVLEYHTLLCDNLLRFLENPSACAEVRKKVLSHGLNHLRRMGETFQKDLLPQGVRIEK